MLRCWDRERVFFEPVQYLALLERKLGGFDHAKPLERWQLPECFALLRRRMEADDPKSGTRSFIRVLRLLERFSLEEVTAGVEYAIDIGLSDSDSIRSVVEHRADGPVRLFSLDGRPHLACVHVETTPVAAYQTLLGTGKQGWGGTALRRHRHRVRTQQPNRHDEPALRELDRGSRQRTAHRRGAGQAHPPLPHSGDQGRELPAPGRQAETSAD